MTQNQYDMVLYGVGALVALCFIGLLFTREFKEFLSDLRVGDGK